MEKDNLSTYDFSVIVCCYNPDIEQLKNTIASILNQKKVTFEIIICDDASKNNYQDLIKNWVESLNINVVFKFNFLEENKGTIINYLEGIKKAEGQFIKPISPGDYLFNEYSLYEYLLKFNEGYDIIFSDSIYYNENELINRRQYPTSRIVFSRKNICVPYCLYSIHFLGATLCERKDIVLNILKEVEGKVKYLEDFSMMTIALIENKKIYGIEKPLVWYEYGTGISTNVNGKNRMQEDSIRILEYLREKYPYSKMVKKMNLKFEMRNKSKFVKAVIFSFKFPLFWYYKFVSFIKRPKKYHFSIDDMKNIIKIKE